jgi:hypothetical protein
MKKKTRLHREVVTRREGLLLKTAIQKSWKLEREVPKRRGKSMKATKQQRSRNRRKAF